MSHSDNKPIDVSKYRVANDYAIEIIEIISRVLIMKNLDKWNPIIDSFDYRFNLTQNSYLLLQQTEESLYEVALIYVEEVKGKPIYTRIAKGNAEFLIMAANDYAEEWLKDIKDKNCVLLNKNKERK
ncbi:hypothetical protein SAMN04487895_10378 [Paenibacillus sophorae]|uniref:Uncharacterized protein n=1 Tax=Paenibacillus sophorae TaxID=1333845 RepID=A0A1H8JMA3_9BACL|nr:hypothetical protein SAMN04487895_10378 [Paenibacillus sophorae]